MGAESGDQVLDNVCPVPGRCLGSNARADDVVQPVCEPLRDGPGLARLAGSPLLPFVLQFADLAADVGLGLVHCVPTVRSTIIPYAHGYPAVPVSVFAEIDRAGVVRCP